MSLIEFVKKTHQITLSKQEAKTVEKIVFESKEADLLAIEQGICKEQRDNSTEVLTEAIRKYHHPDMSTEELITIVTNVNNNRVPIPDYTQTIRVLMAIE